MDEVSKRAYVVAVDMGYGHQRAAFPLLGIAAVPDEWHLSHPIIISANVYPGIPKKDRRRWEGTRKIYEWMSRINSFPFFGKRLFKIIDYVQHIEKFYPKRDLSKPTLQTKILYSMIRRGLGKHLIETLNKKPLPFVTSFFLTAFFAEEHGYKGDIYCLCTDTDIARVWVPLHPKKSRIIYLAPNKRVKDRLELYGVPTEKIVLTGFPLPKELTGDEYNVPIIRHNLARRIVKLDPRKIYQKKYEKIISLYLGTHDFSREPDPVTIMFTVGGAGAQSEIGIAVLRSLVNDIKAARVKLILVAGTSKTIIRKYENVLREYNLSEYKDKCIKVIYHPEKFEYFKLFSKALAKADVLWTKPSELSFYAGLGLPIIMAPTIGAQERSNQAWLHMVGAGFEQDDPRYTHQWFFDWLDSGWLAEAAMNGYLDAPKKGTYHIEDLVLRGKVTQIEDVHFI